MTEVAVDAEAGTDAREGDLHALPNVLTCRCVCAACLCFVEVSCSYNTPPSAGGIVAGAKIANGE
jgi:hypothetical protein